MTGLRSVAQVVFTPPVGLQEDAVDLLEIDGLGSVSDRHHHGSDAEVSDVPPDPFARSCNEAEGIDGEGVVAERDLVELIEDELDCVVRCEFLEQDE